MKNRYPYPSKRNVVYGKNGMVVTSQALAAQAGLEILKKGGNAVDAAVCTAACLTIVEPTSNGIGGDAFAIIWFKDKMTGLNASGRAPKNISIDALKEQGITEMPKYGFTPVTVPGAPMAWAGLIERFGNLSLEEVLKPAIDYAEQGFCVSETVAKYWAKAYKNFKEVLKGDEFTEWFNTFAPNGRVPEAGDIMCLPNHAESLKLIASSKAKAFYEGSIADKIDSFSKQYKGYISKEDLKAFELDWVNPISINYRGFDVWEIPPNGHGIVTLMALNILKNFNNNKEDAEWYHKQIESMKLAYVDGKKYIADPMNMSVTLGSLLSTEYAQGRSKLITDTALLPEAGKPMSGGTVYLATADKDGNMVSYIQSNYMGFGSGLVVPGTGVALHNRGHNFTLDKKHDNCLEGSKKPYHTIIPGFLTKDNKAVGPFGVMGGFMQPQGHVQVISNTLDKILNPQATLDAPRWQWIEKTTVEVEPHFPQHIAEALITKGHDIKMTLDQGKFGRGQIIWRLENGVLMGGCESRCDSVVAAY